MTLRSVCLVSYTIILFNPLSFNINMHILLSVLHIFLMVVVERICTNIKTFACLVIISFNSCDLYV